MFEIQWYVILAAFVLDFVVGDPKALPHPVVAMGKAVSFFENRFRPLFASLFVSGMVFALFLIAVTFAAGWGIIRVSCAVHPVFGALVQIVLLFFCFSSRTLEKEAMGVFEALKTNNIEKSRRQVARIVGRQTGDLDEKGVTRACIETVAENFVDGFLSPLCFAVVGGVPAALAYKMINTLDSMVGYKNEQYLLFGRASARIDDAANFIPARLSVAVISVCALVFSVQQGVQALKTGILQGPRHKSPNAGYPEAAFAGALSIRLGGPSIYHGLQVDKPFIGLQFQDPQTDRIKQACDLMLLSSFFATLISCFALFVF